MKKNYRRHKLLISAIERGGISMDLTDIKRIIRILWSTYADTFDNLDEMDKSLESTNYKT